MDTTTRKNQQKSAGASAAGTAQIEPLEPCDKPHVAEATRTREVDEACDDGVH
ncbi:MAG TPA: hypothetical protein VMX33_05535 [bacterium]|nr:hypothetical protein [bacterium]